jgi:uncharacterized phage protein gp47/JayE
MPNALTSTGLTKATHTELVDFLVSRYRTIYGTDINLEPDSPDSQGLNIFAQVVDDALDLVVAVYNSFDPDAAIGVTLDKRVAINGIERKSGSYTITPVSLVANQGFSLKGLASGKPFTVRDEEGNRWFLIEDHTETTAGTYAYMFRAEFPGEIATVPNTITSPVTIVLGISSVNNPAPYTILGANEETDAQLRIRRRRSVTLAAQGYRDALKALLQNTAGVTFSEVYENYKSEPVDGLPPKCIWVIVSGTAAAEDIARAIYLKRNAGCDMKGANTYVVAQEDGSPFVVAWDDVELESVYLKLTLTSLDGLNPPDVAAIQTKIAERYAPGVYARVNVNELATIVQGIDPNALMVPTAGDGFALDVAGPYEAKLSPSAKNKQFLIAPERIAITTV